MSTQRLTGAQIETAVLQALGYSASTLAPWKTTATFILRANDYVQRLPFRATQLARAQGIIKPSQRLRFKMYKTISAASGANTTTGVQVASGSATIYLPVDVESADSLYDVTIRRNIPWVTDTARYFIEELRNKTPGPAEACELFGYVTEGANWRLKGTLYPATLAGVTPNLILYYHRIPAAMADENAYPDIAPHYTQNVIAGVTAELARPTGQEFDRYSALEQQMLMDMVASAEIV